MPRSTHRPLSLEPLEARIAPAVIFGTDLSNKLFSFDSAAPGKTLSSVPIVGLGMGEIVAGIDFRPANGALYALTTDALNLPRLYTIAFDGTATAVGNAINTLAVEGVFVDIDFNPMVDRVRVVTSSGQNFRMNPDTGEVVDADANALGTQPDAPLTYVAGDVNAGATPSVAGVAYTNSVAGATTTTLLDLDNVQSALASQTPANSGTLSTVASLQQGNFNFIGFDILPGRTSGFTTLTTGEGLSKLATVDLTSGAIKNLGTIAGSDTGGVVSLAALPSGLGISGKTATFRDVDGDAVTVSVSKGTLTQENFTFGAPGANGGVQLQNLDLSQASNGFGGAIVVVTAKASGGGSNGFVNVGRIDASGITLKTVAVKGDLGRLDVAAGNATGTSLGTLTLTSHGIFGNSTQGGGAATTDITINGNVSTVNLGQLLAPLAITGAVKTLNVKSMYDDVQVGSLTTARIGVLEGATLSIGGNAKSLTIGRINDAELLVNGSINTLAVSGDIQDSLITVQGLLNPTTSATAVALKSLRVKGDVSNSSIIAGETSAGAFTNPDAQITSVIVNGSWNGSNLAAGIDPVNGVFGDADDVAISGGNQTLSRIAAISIRGQVSGGGTAFESNVIGKMTIGGAKVPLTADLDDLVVGGGPRVREIIATAIAPS